MPCMGLSLQCLLGAWAELVCDMGGNDCEKTSQIVSMTMAVVGVFSCLVVVACDMQFNRRCQRDKSLKPLFILLKQLS